MGGFGARFWKVILDPGADLELGLEVAFYADRVEVTEAGALVAQHDGEAGPVAHLAFAPGNWRAFFPADPLAGGPCAGAIEHWF